MARLVESRSSNKVHDVRAFEEKRCLSLVQAAQLESALDDMINAAQDAVTSNPEAWRQTRDAYAIRTMLRTGLRRFEFCKTRCGDAELDIGRLWVVGKGNLKDFVPLPKAAVRTIQEWFRAKGKMESVSPRAFMFQGVDGGPISFSNLRLRWRRVLRQAGLSDHYGLHALRHTAGLIVYAQTADLGKTARFLRHTNMNTTAQFYLHVDADALRRELDNVGVWQ